MIVQVLVGCTTRRPIVPDEEFAVCTVDADSETDATLIAAQMVACWPPVEMVTSTTILALLEL